MKRLLLITTKGCKACEIMNNIVEKTISTYNLDYQVKDMSEIEDWILVNIVLEDFPVLLFIEDDVIKFTVHGTCSKNDLIKIIS